MKVPKFMDYLLKNNFKDKKVLLNLEEYRNFTYEKNIVLDEDCIIHIDNRHYQHIVNYSTGGKEKELRSSQFNTRYDEKLDIPYILLIRDNFHYKIYDFMEADYEIYDDKYPEGFTGGTQYFKKTGYTLKEFYKEYKKTRTV